MMDFCSEELSFIMQPVIEASKCQPTAAPVAFVSLRRELVCQIAAFFWAEQPQSSSTRTIIHLWSARPHDPPGRVAAGGQSWKWGGCVSNKQVKEIRKVNIPKTVSFSGNYYPLGTLLQRAWGHRGLRPTFRTRECSEKVKVENAVLVVIHSSSYSYATSWQRCLTIYSETNSLMSAGFLQSIGCPRHASCVGRGCCLDWNVKTASG